MPELGDIDIGVGTLQATNARMAMVVEDSIEQLREWVKQQSSCTCRRIALASAGSESGCGNNWAGVLPVSCWRHTVSSELTEQLGDLACHHKRDDSVYNGYLSMHSRNVWLIAHFKVLIRPWQQPALGQAF